MIVTCLSCCMVLVSLLFDTVISTCFIYTQHLFLYLFGADIPTFFNRKCMFLLRFGTTYYTSWNVIGTYIWFNHKKQR